MTERELFLTAILDCPRHELYVNPRELTDEEQGRLEAMIRRRAQGEPVQYIVGFTEFMGLKFFVDPRVLIPRPETEVLVEAALAKIPPLPSPPRKGEGINWPALFHLKNLIKPVPSPLRGRSGGGEEWRILDLATGSGCIAIALAKLWPQSRVTAVDISPEALEVAKANAAFHSVSERVNFVCTDLRNFLKERDHHSDFFDMILSNPPYIPTKDWPGLPEDVRHEPKSALDGGFDGLDFYRTIIDSAHRQLQPGGRIVLEIGEDQKKAIEDLVHQAGVYRNFEVFQDYAGRDRVITLTT